tara:strand:- start:151 stop:1158 length:1008 start_codon:yes stop_codon:yes gene_type:complete
MAYNSTSWTPDSSTTALSADILTTLTVDNIIVDGTTIGHTDDTDLMGLASGTLTVNGVVAATGNVTVGGTLTSTGTITGILATAAQGNVTSVGTLTTLTVDNVIVNGTTIGHTSDTDLMTLASGALTVKGTVTVGVDDAGHDVKFFGNTASNYMLWDTSADTLKIASTGNASNLILTTSDTDAELGPGITLERTATGADNDALGKIDFYGRDDGGNSTLYARIYSQLLVAADGGEVGSIQFKAMTESASGNVVKTGIWMKGSATNDVVDCFMPNGSLTVNGKFACNGQTAATAPDYTISNLSTDRALDCDSTSDAEVADVLGQVITDLIAIGIFQ